MIVAIALPKVVVEQLARAGIDRELMGPVRLVGAEIIEPQFRDLPCLMAEHRTVDDPMGGDSAEGDDGEGVPIGLLKAKTAIVFNTANTSEERETNIFKDPLETIWKNCIFDLCGVKYFYRKMFSIVITSTPEQRNKWLEEVNSAINSYFPSRN